MPARRLFGGPDIYSVIQHQKELMKQAYTALPDDQALEQSTIDKLVEDWGINVPVLDEKNQYATERQTQVDVSQDQFRHIWDRSRPFYIDVTEVTIHVPFTGDAGLFDVRPTTWNASIPIGDVDGNELLVAITVDGRFSMKDQVSRSLEAVKQHLNWLRPSATQLTDELKYLGSQLLGERKRQIEAHATRRASIEALGIPIRRSEPAQQQSSAQVLPVARTAAKRPTASVDSQHDWDVFISHASEDKDEIARPLAEALKKARLRLWYDEFSLNVGDSLRESIDRGLARSKYGVVILSEKFFEKHWPTKELNGLATREVDGVKVILPVWHKITHAQVRGFSPMLADRVGVSTDKGSDHVVEQLLRAIKSAPKV